jgi:mono/diheme cytochrome c family protein
MPKCFILLVAGALLLAAQDKPQVRQVSPSRTSPASGKDMYMSYCATCHGKDGKGGGPAAPALKKVPTDLTQLAARNGGKFPEMRVYNVIAGDTEVAAHGSKDMPVWGTVFSSMARGNQAEINLRLSNLTKYIESIQAK